MQTTLKEEDLKEAKSRIFNELASAIHSNNEEDWFGLENRAKEILNIATQLKGAIKK